MKAKITVRLDLSTFVWLTALAKANSNTQMNQNTLDKSQLMEAEAKRHQLWHKRQKARAK